MNDMKTISTLLFCICFWIGYSQSPQIEWQNTIGGSGSDEFRTIVQTNDGGYMVAGYSDSNISYDKTENSNGSYDYWIVKLSSAGDIEWQNTIGGSDYDLLNSIDQTSDNGYILGGWSFSDASGDKTENSNGGADYWVVKLDSSGSIVWQNTIGGNDNDLLQIVLQTSDDGYILGGDSLSDISGDKTENSIGEKDYWIVKLNGSGNLEWQNTIGGSDFDLLYDLIETTDGGFLLAGSSQSNISGDKTENSQGASDFWVLKLNSLGDIVWQNTIGGDDLDSLQSVFQTSDGGYILGGISSSDISGDKTENSNGGWDYWVVKLNDLGIIQWQNTIGGDSTDSLFSISETDDNGYLLGGLSHSGISGDKTEALRGQGDYWALKLTTSGTIEWQRTIGGDKWDDLLDSFPAADGGFILGGDSLSTASGEKTEDSHGYDYWIVKLEGTLGFDDFDLASELSISPNPVSDELRLSLENGRIEEVSIFSLQGSHIKTVININVATKGVNVSELAAGVYLIKVISEGKTITRKFIKQ